MASLGQHYLFELYGCNTETLDDLDTIRQIMLSAAKKSGATILNDCLHKFSPQGVSGVVIIAESHLAIHTWPENGYAGVDFFTCGTTVDPLIAYEYIKEKLESEYSTHTKLDRGIIEKIDNASGGIKSKS
ncbi:MAG: S-adenosylmethionine decarboxylase proenzyme [Candidatus Dadabacteria bacterium]|nr:S-adenosylmethionine decarboxylase proenzyme [Candidatus Dadabacteria bacterium]NIV41251.1 S-adenosylmethionine decarboxylase proenzyme [Candidatus Dadabacteria bacterium]NIX15989.1 S-adenosylmethionine decarboxylase proenzyme [Candidatus Dadabacteria bacterium]